MKKLLFSAISFQLLAISLGNASPISPNTAQTAGANFYGQTYSLSLSTYSLSLSYTKVSTTGNPLYYIFNINSNTPSPGQGFIIVAADNASHPILGYSNTSFYDSKNSSPEFASWMDYYSKQLNYIQAQHLQASPVIANEWNDCLNNTHTAHHHSLGAVPPLTNIIWNQGGPFNAMCPGGSVTGCCATAMAQIMKYWNYPAHGVLTNTYNENTPQYSNDFGVISRNFYNDYFNWSALHDTMNNASPDVALLMYDCGVSIDMNYATGGSNGEVICPNAFSNKAADSVSNQTAYIRFFGYDRHTIHGYYKKQFTDTIWITMLENELNHKRLIQYTGGGDIGHTWVCEGYDANNYFFMNWGWGGSPNGYYTLTALNPYSDNFDSLQQALIGIEPPAVSAHFIANNTSICQGSSVVFTDESLTPTAITSWKWSFPGGSPATSTSQNPRVTYNTPGIYNVTLIVTASGGGDTITRGNYIVVQSTGNPLPLSQNFEGNAFPSAGWYLNNPNNWNTSNASYGSIWQHYSHTHGGGFGTSNNCMMFYNYNSGYKDYLINQPPPPNPIGGQNQQIYSPAYDFSTVTKDSLYFDVAYAPFNSVYSDTLAIYYSLDCGVTWSNIYYKGGKNLSTAPVISTTPTDTLGFVPTAAQWRTETIELPSDIYGQPSVMFSFENRSYWGGQLYVDNITIPPGPSTLGVNAVSSPVDEVTLYPNPNNGKFTLQSGMLSGAETTVDIYNVLGEKVYSATLKQVQGDITINLSNQPNGIYFYRVIQENGSIAGQGKLVIQK